MLNLVQLVTTFNYFLPTLIEHQSSYKFAMQFALNMLCECKLLTVFSPNRFGHNRKAFETNEKQIKRDTVCGWRNFPPAVASATEQAHMIWD